MKHVRMFLMLLMLAACSNRSGNETDLHRMSTAENTSRDTTSNSIVIAGSNEPGTPLVVTGTVYEQDGATPIAGARVYVYHTDSAGLYSPTNDNSNPRLHGTMRTGSDGRYEFQTIKPGSYPGMNNPAHIHYVVSAPGYRELNFEIMFDSDPFINDRIRQEAEADHGALVLRPLMTDSNGRLRCVTDIRLTRK
jgi:protocatechuate 3,4-dioxygenase, beta subunit